MKEALDNLGLSPFLLIVIYLLGIITKEIWNILKTNRIEILQNTTKELIIEIENQLHFFYLPIYERFLITKELFDKTNEIGMPYKNESLNIKSNDPLALRKLIVQKLFIPLNKEIEQIILGNLHLRHVEDLTNYDKIVLHYRIWNSLEESINDKLIDNYEASNLLSFPSNEVNNSKKMCEMLLLRRNELRKKILTYKRIDKSFFLLTNKIRHEKTNKI